jgi:Contractile injection system tube protein
MQLQKATIAELDENDAERDPFPVQFNPTTLRLTLNNRVEGNQSQGRQVRQFVGPSSTTLALDLIFDTADEGSSESPRSVREKTRRLERFITPRGSGQQENAPPRLRFTWGDLVMDGVVDNLTIDFDHFAANGAPLRAKVTLSIQGQDRDRELNAQTDNRANAAAPGISISGGLGIGLGASISVSASVSASVGVALGGESGAEFAARVGVDSAAWRGLELGGESSLSLSAGAEIGFNTNLNASAGLGVTLGAEAGASASPEASFGLASNGGLDAVAGVGVGAELASGFALSSAGGVTSALESVQNIKNQTAANQSREAFKLSSQSLPQTQPKLPEQKRTPLKNSGLPSASARASAAAAPPPPRADARASSFGSGVPLRPSVQAAIEQRSDSLQGGASVKAKIASGEPPVTNDPTTPAWVALPARNRTRMIADKVNSQRRPKHRCGCSGGCKH